MSGPAPTGRPTFCLGRKWDKEPTGDFQLLMISSDRTSIKIGVWTTLPAPTLLAFWSGLDPSWPTVLHRIFRHSSRKNALTNNYATSYYRNTTFPMTLGAMKSRCMTGCVVCLRRLRRPSSAMITL